MKSITLLLLTLSVGTTAFAQEKIEEVIQLRQQPHVYAIPKTHNPLNIDGKDTEEAWASAPWSESFVDIEGAPKGKPLYNTKMKMLWDEQYLYIYAKLEEPHIWGDINTHDAIIYHNNDFEVFLKPYENQSTYYEIEINSLNTIMDLVMTKPYRLGGEAMLHWNTNGLKSAVHIEGTNNNPHDLDDYWAIEIAIPFASLHKYGRKVSPQQGDFWRANFSRVQWQHSNIASQYSRKKDNNKLLPEDNWVWSPIGLINMHYPERWGYIQFVEQPNTAVDLPKSHTIERFTWTIYYLQSIYKKKNKKYSKTLRVLQEKNNLLHEDLKKYNCELTTNKKQTFFRIDIKDLDLNIFTTIDSEGNYSIRYDK